MVAVTAEQARDAVAAGRAAAIALLPPDSNPHAVHVPAWKRPREASALAAHLAEQSAAQVLARAWRTGYRSALEERARARGLTLES